MSRLQCLLIAKEWNISLAVLVSLSASVFVSVCVCFCLSVCLSHPSLSRVSGNITVDTSSGFEYGGLYQFFVPPGSLSPGIVFVGFHLPGGCRAVEPTPVVMPTLTQQYRTEPRIKTAIEESALSSNPHVPRTVTVLFRSGPICLRSK